VTLLAFAAERRAAAPLLLGADAVDRYLMLARSGVISAKHFILNYFSEFVIVTS